MSVIRGVINGLLLEGLVVCAALAVVQPFGITNATPFTLGALVCLFGLCWMLEVRVDPRDDVADRVTERVPRRGALR